ncbi:hypothetical protein BI364_05910 [Acidihalobacter yilgarnensis]|uniref:ABM domain-containing protein n=1 Tax=Acidihalobacter yilgarnensis TaxID=2819280 RepID=A0A1D8IMB2_9GAMM|nr:antibiotic biosynthesis monooxygenase [Acidihalobacter yilgarnensis]AOU97555.1 hypothetical protein BI364_05910 [Acidihalobacter yilgarnensis]
MIATTPEPPYYAAIFTAQPGADDAGYVETAARMLILAESQPGFLGVESAHEAGGGITVSYWRDLESIAAWRRHVEHQAAQREGRARWYARYALRVARVERAHAFDGAVV